MIRRFLDWLRREHGREDRVSDLWLVQHAQREGCDGVDGVCWVIPAAGVANVGQEMER